MILAIDTATPQRWLNFALPIAEGYTHIYVKNGGDNVDPTYESPYYDEQIDKARYMGYKKIGHYWVPNADPSDADEIDTPLQQAEFMVKNLRNWNKATDFIVLDNEALDGASRFSDVQTAEFIEAVKAKLGIPGEQVMTYSGLADARGSAWPKTLATGTNFIIAAYSYAAFEFPSFTSIPNDRIVGHQTGGRVFAAVPGAPSTAIQNGVPTDVNTFKDNAFNFGTVPDVPTEGDGELTPDQDNRLTQIYNALFFGGESMEDGGQSISRSLAQINDRDAFVQAIVDALPEGGTGGAGLTKADVVEALKSVVYKAQ